MPKIFSEATHARVHARLSALPWQTDCLNLAPTHMSLSFPTRPQFDKLFLLPSLPAADPAAAAPAPAGAAPAAGGGADPKKEEKKEESEEEDMGFSLFD